ncbi:hypothetical protein O181_057388 [Austropuccinia psidii MF-1]|uniref:Uncharacterized protein n=1 Tax=Austropuccinia psidii MF-1 TaxID=1389203 RepID=A0A9Q3HUF8_9BASI|nr:hypothetical protein [Austropuccinia psidii MF-1]
MSEFMIHRIFLRQCGGYLEHSVSRRTTEQASEEDIIKILEEVTTRTKIGSSRMTLEMSLNTSWKDSVDKSPKESSSKIKYKKAETIGKCHIFKSTANLANKCSKRVKINQINIEKKPYSEKMM